MKKVQILFSSLVFYSFTAFAQQSPLPIVSKPTDNPSYYHSPSEGDNFRATRIVDARIGSDGDWYCLVEFEALSIKNRYLGNVKVGPYLIPGGGIYIWPVTGIILPSVYYKAVTGSTNYAYNPSTESQSNIFQHKTYSRYLPTQKEGAFMWLKANYVSPTQIGLVNNPGNYSVPSNPSNRFYMIFTAGVTTKSSNLESKYWYVQRISELAPTAHMDEVVIDLKINRPN